MLCLAAGIGLIWCVVPGAARFHELISDEGTESFTASFGMLGLIGGLSFLVLLLGLGSILATYAIWLLRKIIKTGPARG